MAYARPVDARMPRWLPSRLTDPVTKRTRSYALPCPANAGKESSVRELLPHWQRGLVHAQLVASRRMRSGERLGWLDTREFPDYLTQRQWKSVVNQVNSVLRSWQELIVIEVRRWIGQNIDGDGERKVLFTANKRHEWWGNAILEPVVVRLMRSALPLPNLSRVRTMNMDGAVANLEASRTDEHSMWARVSLGPGRRPVRLPFGDNPYEDEAAGERANYLSIHVPERGRLIYRVVKHSRAADMRPSGVVLGLDWGLSSLVATSDGRRYGRRLYEWLVERDRELTELTKALAANGIRLRESKRFRNMTRRIRAYVKCEVGRILNTLAASDVSELIVERLDLRGGGLSARLNRIVSRAGRSAFSDKLAALEADAGISTTEVHAPYSSQECSGCGFVERRNRISQNRMRCRFCSKSSQADIDAARVILARRSGLVASRQMSRRDVLAHLDQQFVSRWGIEAGRVRERPRRPHSRASSSRRLWPPSGVNSPRG